MNFPKINKDNCPTAESNQCAAGGDGTGSGDEQRLILEPGFAILCDASTIQFQTFLASATGQIQLSSGLTYSSSDPTILSVDAGIGSGTKLGTGIVTITVQWQDLSASAQITCSGDENCCADIPVEIAVLHDRSLSMGPGQGPQGSKDGAGLVIVKHAFAPEFGGILTGENSKDMASRIDFNDAAVVASIMTGTYADYATNLPADKGNTNIPSAFSLGLQQFSTGVQQVVLVVSDGQEWPAISDSDRSAFLQLCQDFKDDGGLIICVGIGANQDGFSFLQAMASGGFFLNLHFFSGFDNSEAIDLIKGLLCLACAGARTNPDYGCDSSAGLPGPQSPDPNAPRDPESGGGDDGGGGDTQKLPLPVFNPPSGSPIGTGIDVAISVPGHPFAAIKYSIRKDGTTPPAPDTDYLSPIHIAPPLDHGPNLIPAMTSNTSPRGVASASSNNSNAFQAFDGITAFNNNDPASGWRSGTGAIPAWLQYQFTAAEIVDHYSVTIWKANYSAPKDFKLQGSDDGVSWTDLDTRSGVSWFSGETKDFDFANTTGYIYYRLNVSATVPHGSNPDVLVILELTLSKSASVAQVKAKASEAGFFDSDTALAIYPLGDGSSNNGLPIVWGNDDMKPASPYPTTAFVSGLAGTITSVRVKLKNVNAQEVGPKGIILVGPDGTTVVLCYADTVGDNPIDAGVDITFDDAAATPFPLDGYTTGPHAHVTTGSYKPNAQFSNVDFPAPAPASPYQTTLAAFNGKNPNGSWSLYCIHINYYTLFNTNHIDGGWDLILTTA